MATGSGQPARSMSSVDKSPPDAGAEHHGAKGQPPRTQGPWQLSVGRGPVVLLPFDFGDQCTAWLRVAQLSDGLVEVQAGWSHVGQ
jgi:hypothetical protein